MRAIMWKVDTERNLFWEWNKTQLTIFCFVLLCFALLCFAFFALLCFALLCLAWLGLAWLGLAWLGLAWLGLAWLGLAWLGLAWLGFFSALLCFSIHDHLIQKAFDNAVSDIYSFSFTLD